MLDARHESFRFLGFEVGWRPSRTTGRPYPHVEPSQKARQKLRDAVRWELNHWTTGRSCTVTIRTVNQVVRGWSHYFHYGQSACEEAAAKAGSMSEKGFCSVSTCSQKANPCQKIFQRRFFDMKPGKWSK